MDATLIIGAGITGMQAALDIADAGFQAYLVEREPSIGGRMAQLDETFPTLDCSSCILTPKMVGVGGHPNIELLTYSEVIRMEESAGHFKVKVRKKPRYIDLSKCTGCGICAENCRLKGRIDSRFDVGMATRAAVYMPFPQAVPLKYTIDDEHCLMVQRGKCGKSPPCRDACPSEAIDFKQEEEIVELEVAAVIVATGFDPFDALLKPEYGYGVYENVITGLQFERLSSASGPTFGEIKLDDRTIKDVVFIHCVGSRDRNLGNSYCSRVCCMYTAKQAHLVREKLPEARVTVFYTDMRAFGKGFEEFYDRVREERVVYRRGNPSEIYRREGRLVVRAEDTLLGEPIEAEADLVVLAVGLVPRGDAGAVAELLHLSLSEDGFFKEAHAKLRPTETEAEGIFIAGCCQGPKDIPDAVAQAKAAASSAIVIMSQSRTKSTTGEERQENGD